MNRALILNYLQAAEQHIANGLQNLADQRDLILTLRLTGHTATSAIARLREMEETQTQHIADREQLRAQLAVLDAAEAAKADASIVTETRHPQLAHRPSGRG